MNFGNPWMLLGGLAAFIPLLIHLFDRRRPRPHPFPAISFVLRSQKRTASRLKLKRLILYALRTLILLAIPFALARPELRREGAVVTARGPAATAIVLDASLSMRFSDGTPLFETGRELARDAIRDLLPEEPATVLVCGADPQPPGAPGFDRGRLRALVDEAQASFAAANLTRCLELAARALEDTPLAAKRVVLVSDLTANALRLEVPPPTVKGPDGVQVRPEVVLRDAARGKDTLPNRAVVDLRMEPALQAGPRAIQFVFTARNFSPQPVADLEASLRVGDRVVAKGFLEIPAGGTAQKTFTHRFAEGGTFSGEIRLTADSLPEDDARAFTLWVPKELSALVINGEPQSVRYRDEAFFVDAALDAPGSPVRQAMRDVGAGFRESFEGYDLILLLNVPAPSAEDATRLVGFVEKGGGLFVSMGVNVDPDAYNKTLGRLLPRPLRLVKTTADPDEEKVDQHAARLHDISFDHPVFSPFVGRGGEGLTSARFFRYMLLESGTAEGSEVLATFDDGAPALTAARRGKGRVLLFSSTVDRDWSDFAIRTSFLPLMQRLAAYLSGSLDEREQPRARVGERVTLRPGPELAPASVRAPSEAMVPVKKEEDGTTLTVGPVVEPGPHQVLDKDGKPIPSLAFAATLDPSESDLTRLDTDALTAYFGEEAVRSSAASSESPPVPLWTWLIVAAAAAFFLEGLLLRR